MNRYIALLRGINVGGYRKIRMEGLKEMFRGMGFENVTTYIQSGNVIFESNLKDCQKLSGAIKEQIEISFGHNVSVIIRTSEEVEKILARFPFEEKNEWKGYISFLSGMATEDQKRDLKSKSSDIEKFIPGDQEVYSFVNKGASQKLLFSNSFVEKELAMEATTRNLRTVTKILEVVSSYK